MAALHLHGSLRLGELCLVVGAVALPECDGQKHAQLVDHLLVILPLPMLCFCCSKDAACCDLSLVRLDLGVCLGELRAELLDKLVGTEVALQRVVELAPACCDLSRVRLVLGVCLGELRAELLDKLVGTEVAQVVL